MKNKVKILYIITKSNFGGAQKYVFDLATDFNQLENFEIGVALGGDGELIKRLENENINNIKKIKIFKLKNLSNSINPIKLFKQIIEIRKLLKKENPDIIHINSSMAGLAGMLASLFLKNKKIFTAHGWTFNEDRNIFIKMIFKLLLESVVLISDKTIAVSKKTMYDMPKFLHRKFILIYNGIDQIKNVKMNAENIAKNTENKILNRENYTKESIHLVSVGELHPIKGHSLVINALSQIENNNYIYHILGEGYFRKNLEDLIKNLNLHNKIILHGYVKNAREHISEFDIFIMPSHSEALAYALIEGYESGLPVITTNVGGLPEIQNIYNYGVLVEPNIQSIKNTLESWKEENMLEKYKKESLDKLNNGELNKFKKEDMLSNTKKVYIDIL